MANVRLAEAEARAMGEGGVGAVSVRRRLAHKSRSDDANPASSDGAALPCAPAIWSGSSSPSSKNRAVDQATRRGSSCRAGASRVGPRGAAEAEILGAAALPRTGGNVLRNDIYPTVHLAKSWKT